MLIIRIACISLALITFAITADAAALEQAAIAKSGLTVEQARQIMMLVLKHEHFPLNKDGFYVEALPNSEPGYQDFGVTLDSPDAGATTALGSFAVSRMTGDVWETNLCKRYNFDELRQLQAHIMKRTGQTFKTERAKRLGLGCTDH